MHCRNCKFSEAFVEGLWKRYEPYADSKFPQKAQDAFHQRFWEMYLGVSLLEKGLNLTKHSDKGPEFYVQLNDKKVWFEAIAPGPGDKSKRDTVPKPEFGKGRDVPIEQKLLRFTNALATKSQCYVNALSEGIIAPDDGYVLAINSYTVSPGATIGYPLPYIVQALFGIGTPGYAIDPVSHDIVDSYCPHLPYVAKSNAEKIPMGHFRDGGAAFCSAVIHSSVDCANYPAELGQDFLVVLNPTATHQIPIDTFPWWTRYTFNIERNELKRLDPAAG